MRLLKSCLVCNASLSLPILHLPGPKAVTSLGYIISAETIVYQCEACSHVQTAPLEDVREYYSSNYNIRSKSKDEDDLYEVVDGMPVYRSQHQASVIFETHPRLAPSARVLDYGCAKASSLRYLLRDRPDVNAFVYDVSDAYQSYWSEFIPPENQSSFLINSDWLGTFDLVLSFFALEHTEEPVQFIQNIENLLRPGGKAHLVFPNMYDNYGDMIVVDHINHFSESSIRELFSKSRLNLVELSASRHRAAFVVVAEKVDTEFPDAVVNLKKVGETLAKIEAIAEFWRNSSKKISSFEEKAIGEAAIYGSGVYGMFILVNLKRPSSIKYFLDQNPHQQAKTFENKSVIEPAKVGKEVGNIYVGLNPTIARKVIDSNQTLGTETRSYLFL